MNTKAIILCILTAITINCSSQNIDSTAHDEKGDRNFSLLLGYNFWGNHFAELGFAINELERWRFKYGGRIISLSTEIKIDNVLVIGPKIGFWIGGNTGGFGLNAIYYTDFKEGALRFRPELGLGLSRFKIAYGYNIALSNKEFAGVNKSNIALNILFPMIKMRKGTF